VDDAVDYLIDWWIFTFKYTDVPATWVSAAVAISLNWGGPGPKGTSKGKTDLSCDLISSSWYVDLSH